MTSDPVDVALAWVRMIGGDRLDQAWSRTTSLYRLSWCRRWSWRHQVELRAAGDDPLELAGALAADGPDHPLWSAFVEGHRSEGDGRDLRDRFAWAFAATRSTPLAPDMELVELEPTRPGNRVDPETRPVSLVVRLTPTGWMIAGAGRDPAEPTWPPGS